MPTRPVQLIDIELCDGPLDSDEDADEACSAKLVDIELFDGKVWQLPNHGPLVWEFF